MPHHTIALTDNFFARAVEILQAHGAAHSSAFGVSDMLVYVPSTRMKVALQNAWAHHARGGVALLPRIKMLSIAAEDLPPTCASATARRAYLVRQIKAFRPQARYQQLLKDADALADLLDTLTTHRVPWGSLQHVITGNLAQHWYNNLKFLNIALEHYPAWLHENEKTDACATTQTILAADIQALKNYPHAVAAVGFTDTTPLGHDLLATVQAHPRGCIITVPVENIPFTLPTDFTLIESESIPQQALTIAIAVRETLAEKPKADIAIITPDPSLANTIATQLARLGVVVDNSAGSSLAHTPLADFLLLLTAYAAQKDKTTLTHLLTHPCAHIEENLLKETLAFLRHPRTTGLPTAFKNIFAPLVEQPRHTLEYWQKYMFQVAESLCPTFTQPPLFTELQTALQVDETALAITGSLNAEEFYDHIHYTLSQSAVRAPDRSTVRLWGPLEARLMRPDVVILAGLNRGVWPPARSADPWLNESLRAQLGLPTPTHHHTLNRWDFATHLHAPRVVATYAKTGRGDVQSPSAFITELALLAGGETSHYWRNAKAAGEKYKSWAQQCISSGAESLREAAVVSPPLHHRPREWSATAVADLLACPYKFYVQRILKLKASEEVDALPDVSDKGNALHKILAAFFKPQGDLPVFNQPLTETNRAAAIEHLLLLTDAVLANLPAVEKKLWRTRMENLAPALVDRWVEHPSTRSVQAVEQRGELQLADVKLFATADRIDEEADGWVVLDYKSGTPPKAREVAQAEKPQLAVEALIATRGGFGTKKPVVGLETWHLRGTAQSAVDVEDLWPKLLKDMSPDEYISQVENGINKLAEQVNKQQASLFAKPGDTAGRTRTKACQYCDFAGLCRFEEGSVQL